MELIAAIVVTILLIGVIAALVVSRRPSAPTGADQPRATTSTVAEPDTDDASSPTSNRGPPTAVDTLDTLDTVGAPDVVEGPTVIELDVAGPAVEAPLSLRDRFQRRLARTRNVFATGIADLFGRGIDAAAWDGLEEMLIGADVGVDTTMALVEQMRQRVRAEGVTTAAEVVTLLKQELRLLLGDHDRSLTRAVDGRPTVWLVTGVNGTGKTTTIGKLAAREQRDGTSVVLAAADTFRAAAADQLAKWAQRSDAYLVRSVEGADPAAVAFDGYLATTERGADLLMVDTAGRLHNKRELMDELGKVKRVIEKQAGPIHETLLVLDATTGQNGIAQARAFMEAVDITGLVLTKLDGSSKGGIVIAVQKDLGLPVKLVGLGEDIDDLADFDPDAFVDGLFDERA